MAGKKQNMCPMWKKLVKNVDLEEPTSFLDHVYLGCIQRECKPNEIIIEQHSEMFESRISAEATKNYQGGKNLTQKNVEWPCDMEGYAQKCVERYRELAKKKFKQLCEVSTTCLRGF